MFTFIHAADIHLDSPLKNLTVREDAPVETIRSAARRAFDNLVQLAIDEEVNFLLLAGDLYDGTWKDYNTGLFFIERMHRLRRAGIRVFLVSGNHDAASRITRTLRLPDNVTHFSSQKPRSVRIEGLDAVIHGQSYAHAQVSENLAQNYPAPVPHLFNIGLLHTSLTGRPGHETYAPCSRDELIHKGYDYWALGHIHQREEVCRDPWIIFPGNLQGRHIRETGAKGAILVRVDNNRACEVSFRELDVIRWGFRRIDCREVISEAELQEVISKAFWQESASTEGRPLMLRLELHGSSPFHEELLRDRKYWTNNLEALAIDSGDIWLEKILFHTRRSVPMDTLALEGTPMEVLLNPSRLPEDDFFGSPELQALLNRLPAELLREQPLIPEDGSAKQALLDEVREMVLARILRQVDQ